MTTDAATEKQEEELKAALWYAIGKYVDEESLNRNLNATPHFIASLTELVYTQIANTSRDLESFAKHAGRRAVNTDDVMLLSRRNEGLETVMREKLDEMKAREGRGPGKAARGKASGKGKGKARP
ncbi:kinetochore component CENP-S-domain-containing protein [Dendryphion nanum]|uniref:Kinetochore component CENP-S-domain-containing protein n=1 Tax=Dendryphion nanum TaxID=256645 RepID=A0A9P9DN63_9PLEO|nr:kinetochore component CENP-S-domain-containing protein [Dendryphion nanum]